MPGSGTGIFPEPDDYRSQLPGTAELLLVAPAPFHARLTWVELPRLHLLRAQETAQRVRYVALPPGRVFVTFPLHRDTVLICGGTEVTSGALIFHAAGERFHERTVAPANWGVISMRIEGLALFGRTLTGSDIAPPATGLIIRPKAADRLQLVRLHTRVARIAETNIDRIGHQEVSRALEEDLIWTLLTCLDADSWRGLAPVALREPLMVRFEEVLAASAEHIPGLAEICESIGTSQSILQCCCLKVLGMSPARYLHLRRLTFVQALLTRGELGPLSTSHVPRQHGFADFHHFVTEYRRAFGSIPARFNGGR